MHSNSKERGMIFNAEMVRAILSGQKTQTRRIVKNVTSDNCMTLTKPSKNRDGVYTHVMDAPKHGLCPHGTVGDRIWVRETWQGPLVDFERSDDLLRNPEKYEKPENCVYEADGVPAPEFYDADDNLRCCWRPSIHMPIWASRILLEITNVRVERLNDISEQDAIAEGIERYNDDGIVYYGPYGKGDCRPERAFSDLWKSIYGDESWEKNPWVWCISFKRVQEQSN
ncbi:hypothetical protein, partial [Hafnia paralvei]|uniref:hypothetical protein n=1 Tax=Hafnia paralvei TaxID=546367 RepID=UPI003C35FA6B